MAAINGDDLSMKQYLWAAALALAASSAHANEVYAGLGVPGLQLGYSQAVMNQVSVRGELATSGRYTKDTTQEGIDYSGQFKYDRAAVFADWFVAGNGFRVTGGLTFNRLRVELEGRGNGGSIDIGSTTYTTTADDRFNVDVKYPTVMPYLGIGWGHHETAGKGFSFVADLGVSFGKPKVTGSVSGPQLSGVVTQADIDRELAEVRNKADDYKVVPQITVGVSYRF
ncbi:MAG TPA: hypothetical protein VFS42_12875 [Burkholderiaceae bacterium]|nr:hypothetical protein [Burkholderiaceae bacterium]